MNKTEQKLTVPAAAAAILALTACATTKSAATGDAQADKDNAFAHSLRGQRCYMAEFLTVRIAEFPPGGFPYRKDRRKSAVRDSLP